MEVALVRVTLCRHTGKKLSEEIIEKKEVDEDEFYRPLVEVLGNAFLKHKKGCLDNGEE